MKEKISRRITVEGEILDYEITRKNVKNLNLRVKEDQPVQVSANERVPLSQIDKFVKAEYDFILRARMKIRSRECEKVEAPPMPLWTKEKQLLYLTELCREIYPYFEEMGIQFPMIRVRNMKSRWGSCHYTKGVITFNTLLLRVTRECARYVAVHEFCHLVWPNHGKEFWNLVESLYPQWKARRKELNNYRF